MRSMTGFGRGTAAGDTFSITIELKTVNNRFLDVSLKLSNELQSLESAIKRAIGDRVSRGRMDVNLQYDRTSDVAYELNRPLITGFLTAMKEMQAEFGLAGEPDLNVVARLPNVLMPKRDELDEAFREGALQALHFALDDLDQMRASEGRMLRDELALRLNEIEKRLPAIVAESASVGEE